MYKRQVWKRRKDKIIIKGTLKKNNEGRKIITAISRKMENLISHKLRRILSEQYSLMETLK